MRIPIRVAAALVFCAATSAAQGRDGRSVQPERPTVATHAGTVRPGFLEVEWGADYGDGPGLTIPVYFKLGLRNRLQFGLLLPFARPFRGSLGLADMGAALKWRLFDDAPLLGDFAIQPSVSLPTGDGSTGSDATMLFISSHEFGKAALDLNAGVTASRGGGTSEMWAISLGFPTQGEGGFVAELSGVSRGVAGPRSAQLLFGPTYSFRPWFSVDVGVVLGGSQSDTRFYFGGVTNFGRIIGK